MDPVVATYVAYLTLSIALIVWVSRVLSRSGIRFLADVFEDDDGLARAVNQLLLVGFYLVSFGYVAITMGLAGGEVVDTRTALEQLVPSLGIAALGLGLLHVINLGVLTRIRARRSHRPVRPYAPTYPVSAPPPPQQPGQAF